jgi:hypothetical protein
LRKIQKRWTLQSENAGEQNHHQQDQQKQDNAQTILILGNGFFGQSHEDTSLCVAVDLS